MTTSPESGRIWLRDGMVHYQSPVHGSWSIPVSELRIVGEYTNDQGPMLDDWFMIFVTIGPGWYEASKYADGRDEFQQQLARLLGAEHLHGELAASAVYASRIIWPASLQGQQLFDFTPVRMPRWRQWLRFGAGEVRIELSSQASAHVLEGAHPPDA